MDKSKKYNHDSEIKKAEGLAFGITYSGKPHDKVVNAKVDKTAQKEALKKIEASEQH